MTRLTSFLLSLAAGFVWLVGTAGAQQVMLNANPLDPFPPNAAELTKLGEKLAPIKSALQYFREGNIEKLRESLTEARKMNADLPQNDVLIARLLMAAGQWPDAYALLESHVAINASDANAYKNFAEIAMVTGRWTDAWLQLEKCMSLVDGMNFSPTRKQNFLMELTKLRAEIAVRRQDKALGTKLYEELAKQQPKDGLPLWSLGEIKVGNGDIEGGVAMLKKAKALTTELPQPELAVAIALAGGKEPAKADEWFRKGLTIGDGSDSEANWTQYLIYLLSQDKAEDAKKLADRIPEKYKGSRSVRMVKGQIHRFLGENAEAEKIFSALHQENSDDLEAADNLALVLVESTDEGKRARADQISEANVRRAQNVERIIATAAWVKYKTGSTDVADKVLTEIVRSGRCEPQTAYYAAMLCKSRNAVENYVFLLDRAVSGGGSFPQKRAAIEELKAIKAKMNNAAAPAPAPAPAPVGKDANKK
jgi:tetratricopeptide (TPR) repeat protein